MNNLLALHFEEDYVVAGVEPLRNNFHLITKAGESRFAFYFFVDDINHKIDYSLRYKKKVADNIKNYFGNFWETILNKQISYRWYDYDLGYINLILPILDDIKDCYFDILNEILENPPNKEDKIPVLLSFSDNIAEESRQVLVQFLVNQNFELKLQKRSLPDLLGDHWIRQQGFPDDKPMKIAVLEALGRHLNMSCIEVYDLFDRRRTASQSFSDFGIDPRQQVVAKKLVDDINKQHNLLQKEEDLRREYQRHYNIAEEIVHRIEATQRPYIEVETNFSIASGRTYKLMLDKEEIDQLTNFHVQQLSRFFDHHFVEQNRLVISNIDAILLLGNTLNNELIRTEFARFGKDRIYYYADSGLRFILQALLYQKTESSGKAQTKASSTLDGSYLKQDFVSLNSLQTGKCVRLQNNDPTPGKGDSTQELQYLGNNRFKVISSTRSLQAGDIATALMPAWVPGINLDFSIERAGRTLGIFRTRTLISIEIR